MRVKRCRHKFPSVRFPLPTCPFFKTTNRQCGGRVLFHVVLLFSSRKLSDFNLKRTDFFHANKWCGNCFVKRSLNTHDSLSDINHLNNDQKNHSYLTLLCVVQPENKKTRLRPSDCSVFSVTNVNIFPKGDDGRHYALYTPGGFLNYHWIH